jgi:hypothetical protein
MLVQKEQRLSTFTCFKAHSLTLYRSLAIIGRGINTMIVHWIRVKFKRDNRLGRGV